MSAEIIQGDCLAVMPSLQAHSVDLVLTDLPYGVTQNPNDVVLPLSRLWAEWKRLLKPDRTVILTSQFPFTIDLIQSNRDWFKYDLIWDKILVTGHLNANRMPLRVHEHILVFYDGEPYYVPQKTMSGMKSHSKGAMKLTANRNYGKYEMTDSSMRDGLFKHPQSIVSIAKPHPSVALHPTEKPVELAEFIVKNYTREGDTILDCCAGVGWTAVAAAKLQRKAICIEINPEYIELAKERLGPWLMQERLTMEKSLIADSD